MMSGERLRVGIIGFGGIGRVHLEAYRNCPDVAVVGIADPRLQASAAPVEGAALFNNHDELLQTVPIDIACICTPARHHLAIASDVAKHGVHILCEKPLAPSSRDASSIVDVCASNGIRLAYGASYRHLPAVAAARALISAGTIGEVRLIREQVIGGAGPAEQRPLSIDHYPEGSPGGTGLGLVDHGIHLVDLFRWFTGSEPTNIWGRGNRAGKDLAPEYLTVEMTCGAVGQLCYDDGTFDITSPDDQIVAEGFGWNLSGEFSAGDRITDPGHIDVHGSAGALRIYHYANLLFLNDRSGYRRLPCQGRPPPGHFATQMIDFVTALNEGREPNATGNDGVKALRMIEGAYVDRVDMELC